MLNFFARDVMISMMVVVGFDGLRYEMTATYAPELKIPKLMILNCYLTVVVKS